MDVNSGRLVADIELVDASERDRFKRLPAHLVEDAVRALAGREETTINLNAQSNLASWAANVRKKNRTRAKMAKRSRARNRK
jgi:hypothetical protein